MTMFTTSSTTGSVQTSAGQAFGIANKTSSLTPLMALTPLRHELPAAVGPAPPLDLGVGSTIGRTPGVPQAPMHREE